MTKPEAKTQEQLSAEYWERLCRVYPSLKKNVRCPYCGSKGNPIFDRWTDEPTGAWRCTGPDWLKHGDFTSEGKVAGDPAQWAWIRDFDAAVKGDKEAQARLEAAEKEGDE